MTTTLTIKPPLETGKKSTSPRYSISETLGAGSFFDDTNAPGPKNLRGRNSLPDLFNRLRIDDGYLDRFMSEQMEPEDILLLSDQELRKMLPPKGPRLRLLNYLASELQNRRASSPAPHSTTDGETAHFSSFFQSDPNDPLKGASAHAPIISPFPFPPRAFGSFPSSCAPSPSVSPPAADPVWPADGSDDSESEGSAGPAPLVIRRELQDDGSGRDRKSSSEGGSDKARNNSAVLSDVNGSPITGNSRISGELQVLSPLCKIRRSTDPRFDPNFRTESLPPIDKPPDTGRKSPLPSGRGAPTLTRGFLLDDQSVGVRANARGWPMIPRECGVIPPEEQKGRLSEPIRHTSRVSFEALPVLDSMRGHGSLEGLAPGPIGPPHGRVSYDRTPGFDRMSLEGRPVPLGPLNGQMQFEARGMSQSCPPPSIIGHPLGRPSLEGPGPHLMGPLRARRSCESIMGNMKGCMEGLSGLGHRPMDRRLSGQTMSCEKCMPRLLPPAPKIHIMRPTLGGGPRRTGPFKHDPAPIGAPTSESRYRQPQFVYEPSLSFPVAGDLEEHETIRGKLSSIQHSTTGLSGFIFDCDGRLKHGRYPMDGDIFFDESCNILASEEEMLVGTILEFQVRMQSVLVYSDENIQPKYRYSARNIRVASNQIRKSKLMEGRVMWYRPDRRYGFIFDSGGNTYFFHRSELQCSELLLHANTPVCFRIQKVERGSMATDISLVDQESALGKEMKEKEDSMEHKVDIQLKDEKTDE